MKLRWKTLNPNQRTYTKLGRPRLLPTDQIENPELGLNVNYLSDESKSAASTPATVPTPPSSTESNQRVEVKTELTGPDGLPEPIIDPLGEESEEEMSSEDLHIFNAFLRGQSSGSMKLDGSFRNLLSLSDINYDSARNSATFGGSSGSLQRGSSVSWAQLEGSGGEAKPHPHALRKKLVSMMSLGSARSLSLRSLTEVDPDDRFLDDALNKQLSGMSLLGDDTDDAIESTDNQTESTHNAASLGTKMDSFEDAQLIAEAMLNPVDMTKPTFSEQLNRAGFGAQASASAEVDQALLNEFLYPGGAVAADATATTVSEHDFYNDSVSLDLLSSADRFEI